MPFLQLFQQVHNIPSIPKVVQELIDGFNNETGRSKDIAKKIEMDQALSLKVLRLANSARYGAGRKVSSIDSAVVMLGYDTLKTLVIASGITAACKDIPGLDQKVFWRSSFSVANIARLIARLSGANPETAFACGMLHNVGDTLLYLAHGEKMKRIDALVAEGANKLELQQNQFGYDYQLVGSELARRWNFPEEVVTAIALQSEPLKAPGGNPFAAITHIAAKLYRQLEADKSKEEMLRSFPTDIAAPLNLDLVNLFEHLITLFETEDDLDELLS